MSFSSSLVPFPVVLPMLGAALLAGARKLFSRAVNATISFLIAAATLAICCILLHASWAHTLVYWFGGWHPRGSMVLGIVFVVDPLSAGLALLASVLMLLAILFSSQVPDCGEGHIFPLMLIFFAGMNGFLFTGDLFNLFVFFELMSTAAFALCGLNTRENAPLQGSFNFAVTNTVAAFLIVSGIALLYAATGALNMAQIGFQIGLLLGPRHDALVMFAFGLLLTGFLTKAAILPFHFWLADAHSVAPTAVCVLFSGIMVELGLYAVVRLNATIFAGALALHPHLVRTVLITLGAGTAIFGAVMSYAEHHLKRLLAFSTVSHSGLMLIAVGMLTPESIGGFVLYFAGHALVKATLFFTAGLLLHRLRSMSERILWAKGCGLWWMAVLWFGGGLGLAAVPLFATASGESVISSAAEALGLSWVSFVFFFSGALTAAAVFRVGLHTFFGAGSQPVMDQAAAIDELPEDEDREHIPWTLWLPPAMALLGAAALLFVPHLASAAAAAAERLMNQPAYLHTVYTGQTPQFPAAHAHRLTTGAATRGTLAAVFAFLLACTSVFRARLPRGFRLGAYMEGPLTALRSLQSGHPGDYVLWLTLGAATLCLVSETLLTR